MSVAIFCVKVNVIYSLFKVDRFSFRNADKAKIDQGFLSTITPQGKDRDSFDPRSQNLLGKDSTWMVDRLRMPCIIDCFFFSFYNMIELQQL